MDNFAPSTKDKPNYRWESDFGGHFIGYAARDSFNTPKISHPQNAKAVGESVNRAWDTNTQHLAIDFSVYDSIVLPALAVYTLEPIIAPAKYDASAGLDAWEESYPVEIYTTAHRDLNYVNRIEDLKFDAASLQFVTNALGAAILAPLAELLKVMDFSQMTDDANNAAIQHNRLVQAMGYTDGLGTPEDGQHDFDSLMYSRSFDGLVAYVNQRIFGKLNSYYWCWDFFPGMYTWAAQLGRSWCETKSPCNNTTLILTKLDKVYRPDYDSGDDPDKIFPGIVKGMWTLKRTNKPKSLWGMAKHIKRVVDWLASDDSFRNITTTMQTIMNKKEGSVKLDDGMTIYKNAFEFYPYRGRLVEFHYEPAMLIAFHNATVAPLEITDTHEVATNYDPDMPNKMVQLYLWSDALYSSVEEADCSFNMLRANAVYDMPEMWDCDDYEAVTVASFYKWMIHKEQNHPARNQEIQISPKTLGNTVITNVAVFRPHVNSDPEQDIYFPWNPDDFKNVLVNFYDETLFTQRDVTRKICLAANISSMPMQACFVYDKTTAPAYSFAGWATDLTTLSFMDFRGLENVKTQLLLNAGAYPLNITGGIGEKFAGLEIIGSKVANAQNNGAEAAIPANGEGSNTGDAAGSTSFSDTKKLSRSEKKQLKDAQQTS